MKCLAFWQDKHGVLRFAPLALLVGACQLVVAPSGAPHEETDEAGVEARECGERTCGADTVCCNASCGICTAPGNVCIQIACEPEDRGATCSTVLCGPDELCMETPAGAVCVPAEENPCNLIDCQPGSSCSVEGGEPICVPGASGGDGGRQSERDAGAGTPADDAGGPAPELDAGALDAGEDADAAELDASAPLDAGSDRDGGSSQKDAGSKKDAGVIVNPPISCAVVLCPSGTYCDDVSGNAQCIPFPSCATVKCSAGYECELEPVVCVRAPCPPQPRCVPEERPGDPCGGKCKGDQYCQVIPIQCITTPCPPPVAQCLARSGCGCTGKGACLNVPCPVLEPR